MRYSLYKNGAPEVATKARDAAIALLRDIAAGRASLGAPEGAPTPPAAAPSHAAPARVFDDTGLAGY